MLDFLCFRLAFRTLSHELNSLLFRIKKKKKKQQRKKLIKALAN